MAVPTRSIVTQTYEGETIECVKFSCSEASDFRIENVAPVNDNYCFQMVIRSTGTKTVSVTLGGVTKTISITGTLKRYTLTFLGTVVTSSKDIEIGFPTGDYWIYNVQLERASSPSAWRPAPEDANDYADSVASSAVQTANTYAQLTAEQKAAAAVEAQTQQSIFNKLTNNGQVQGLYLSAGKIYLNATYIQTGTLSIKKGSLETFYANADTGVIRIKADEFSLSDGTTLASTLSSANTYANTAASNAVNAQTQLSIFNKLTNNGQTQGIYLSSGKIYINASYIRTGTFSVSKNGVETFSANASTGVVKIKADEFSLSDGTTLASTLSSAQSYANTQDASTLASAKTYADGAASSAVDAQTQLSIFNKLTNNGQTQGIYLSSGKIYINATYISTGTMSAARISGGILQDTQGNMVWNLGTGAMTAKNLSITTTNFTLSSAGSIMAKSGTVGGFTIDSTSIRSAALNSTSNNAVGISTANFTRSINGTSRTTLVMAIGSKFGVSNAGVLYASDAVLSGTITSTSGSIGGWGIESYGLYLSIDGSWHSYIGKSGHISRNIAGSGQRSDWIAVFGSKVGVNNNGALYCSEGYMNNVTLQSGCNANAIAANIISAASANIQTIITNTVTADYITARHAVLGYLTTTSGGVQANGLIYSTSTVSGDKINGRNGFQVGTTEGKTANVTLVDTGGYGTTLQFTNGLYTGAANGTYTFYCTKTFYYSKNTQVFYAYESSSSTTKSRYSMTYVTSIGTAGQYSVTI